MLDIAPIKPEFGAEVRGVDLARGADEATMRALADALYEHKLIVIKGQELTKEQYMAFGERWGTPIPHVLDHLRMPGFPGMMSVGNTEEKDKKDTVRNGAVFWHTDQSYDRQPASLTMLHAVMAPAEGGETMFADARTAYEALDESTKAEIDGLRVHHLYGAASGKDGEKIASPFINDEQRAASPTVTHPLVLPHPVTGKKALYAVAGTWVGVDGWDGERSEALLSRLKRHVLSEPFRHDHKYEVGDIAIYDTWSTLHSGSPVEFAERPEQRRMLWRISIRGFPAFVQARSVAAE